MQTMTTDRPRVPGEVRNKTTRPRSGGEEQGEEQEARGVEILLVCVANW